MKKRTHPVTNVTDVVALLRAHQIRPTRQRVRIGTSLFACDQHVTAAELWQRLRHDAMPMTRATIYNTLELFASKGLIRELDIGFRGFRGQVYDTNLKPHYHVHYLDSGRVEDLDPRQVDVRVSDQLLEQARLVGVDVTLKVSG